MNTTQIRYFLLAAKCLNFTEAAQKLYISQLALSKQYINKAELLIGSSALFSHPL